MPSEWQRPRSWPSQSGALASAMRQVRACCLLLARTTPDLITRVSLILPLSSEPGEALEILRQGERLAQGVRAALLGAGREPGSHPLVCPSDEHSQPTRR